MNEKITKFLDKYKIFKAELDRMAAKRNSFKGLPDVAFEMQCWKFRKTVELDVEKAWATLNPAEKEEAAKSI